MSAIGGRLSILHEASGLSRTATDQNSVAGNVALERRKVHETAIEFEAILLSSLLEKMEQTVQMLPGDDADPGHDNFQSMGLQAVGKEIAANGGLGIARSIETHLRRSQSGEGITGVTAGASRWKAMLPMSQGVPEKVLGKD